jgi:hypothetical protein
VSKATSYRLRAEHLRASALNTKDAVDRAQMVMAADDYDELALAEEALEPPTEC